MVAAFKFVGHGGDVAANVIDYEEYWVIDDALPPPLMIWLKHFPSYPI